MYEGEKPEALEEGRQKKRRRRRPRLRPFEIAVMAIGYGTILYWIARGLVLLAVWLAR